MRQGLLGIQYREEKRGRGTTGIGANLVFLMEGV